ncbi:MAG: HDOD domain-containing protein [Kangiellaceae bacterium]|jgi:HD-like signal output (HDOD) protein|nr:HDOD domain-containing protein [Kangiellaceae bacterium]
MSENQLLELLKQYSVFEFLSEHDLAVVAGQAYLLTFDEDRVLFNIGDDDSTDYLLITGSVELTAGDGKVNLLTPQSEAADKPIANLRPRMYTAVTKLPVRLLALPHDLMSFIIKQHHSEESAESLVEFKHAQMSSAAITSELMQAINKRELNLPSIPEVAVKIREYAENEAHSMEELVQVLQMDPAISLKLIQAANGPLYRGVEPIQSLSKAVVRLGKQTVQLLVMIFALRELFEFNEKALQHKITALWNESIDVAAICALLAKKSKLPFDPEVAMLLGLLHRIGELTIYSYMVEYKGFLSIDETIDDLVKKYHRQVACEIVEAWGLGDTFFQAMKYMEHWNKEAFLAPDYCDLLNIAILHEYIRSKKYNDLPQLGKLPAFSRIQVGEATPEFSIQVLQESMQELNEIKSMLRG